MFVLKVNRGDFDIEKLIGRYSGCTVTLKNEGKNTLIMVDGLKVKLSAEQERLFVETCRLSLQPTPTHTHHHGQGGFVQSASTHMHREGQGGFIQSAPTHTHKSNGPNMRQGPTLSQGAWLCPKSYNGE